MDGFRGLQSSTFPTGYLMGREAPEISGFYAPKVRGGANSLWDTDATPDPSLKVWALALNPTLLSE